MKTETPTPNQTSPQETPSGRQAKALKISSKITLLSFGLVILTVTVLTAVITVQKSRLSPVLTKLLDEQADAEAAKLTKAIYDAAAGAEAQIKQDLDHSLEIARELFQSKGAVALAAQTVSWESENQVSHEKVRVDLPRVTLGTNWLGQNSRLDVPSLVVDDAKHYTSAEVTIFQRINDSGDMLRVCTSVARPDGTRAIGTFIPVHNGDGSTNPVIATVLKGETYKGRAMVLNAWHNSAYEPLWDGAHQRIIGMLFVGLNMTESTRSVRQSILNIALGKSGYMFVLGSKGDLRGRYIISPKGEQDGVDVWESKDQQGNLVVQDIVKKALATSGGKSAKIDYLWSTKADPRVRSKFALVSYYEPWDWVIGSSGYYDEYREAQKSRALSALTTMLWWTAGASGFLALVAFVVSARLSLTISKPINVLAETADRIAKGDNSARAAIISHDEIGQLAESFNSMIEARVKAKEDTDDYKRLQEGISDLLKVTSEASDGDLTVRAPVTEGALGNVSDAVNLMLENVGELLTEVQAAANRVASSATEIQASSEQLSQGSMRQTGEIVNTTTAVQEMAANIESVSNNATSAAEAASRARLAADNGAKAVQQVIEGMERIRQNVQAGAKKIKRLGERSMEISTIVNTISQISAQTDMLALNAAIEAARAGEHGRGFTVVAEEVRKLAERTAAATKEIEKLIAGIQAETNESVSAMEQQTTEVESESKVVSSTGSELVRIRESSNQSAELINEINLAAKQQVRGASGVVKAMETVSTIAQQAQSGAGQTKRATESLASLSSELLSSLGKFKITSNGSH